MPPMSSALRSPPCGLRSMSLWPRPGPVPEETVVLAGRLRDELDHVDRLLESFLALAHAQRGPDEDEATLELGDLVSSSIERHAPEIEAMQIDLVDDECLDLEVSGSRDVALADGRQRRRQRRQAQRTRRLDPRKNRRIRGQTSPVSWSRTEVRCSTRPVSWIWPSP